MRDGPWKLGNLCFTNKRLIFLQANKPISRITLGDVIDVGIRKGRFILGRKKQLLFILGNKERQILNWFAVNNPEEWKNKIRNAIVVKGVNHS